MFDRGKYKDFARTQLRGRWKIPILMVIFTTIITSILEGPTIYSSFASLSFMTDPIEMMEAMNSMYTPASTAFTFLEIIVSFILEMAMISVFVKMTHSPDPINFGDFIEGFSTWLKAILIGLWQTLFVFLWSLLLFFPGIIKYYSYSQMYYLSCEYPNVSVPKLMQISKKITKGHKWDLFVLDLSFIGWAILTGLTFGILGLWFIPYYNMTKVNAYHAILKDAIDKNIVSKEDVQ